MDLQEKLENEDGGDHAVYTPTIDWGRLLLSNVGVKVKN